MEDSFDDKDGPITFEDLGLQRSDPTKQTAIGKIRTVNSLTKWEWLFLVVSILSLLASVGLTIQRLATLSNNSDDITFAILLLVTSGFCFYYIIKGVLQESLYEIFVFIGTIAILLVYCATNYALSPQKNAIKLVRLVCICIIGPFLAALGLWIMKGYHESGNLVYRSVGANAELQSICRNLLKTLSLLVFDLQLQCSILVLVLKNGTKVSHNEVLVLSIGAVLAALYFVIGITSMIYESKIGIFLLWCLSVFEPGYIIYKLYIVKRQHYSPLLLDCLIGAVIIGLVIRITFVIFSVFVFKNFKKGLKERVYGIKEFRKGSDASTQSVPTSSTSNIA